MLPYLRGHNLFGYVDVSTLAPPMFDETSTQISAAYLAWKQQDQALMSLLISSLSESIIALVLEATSAREVWNILDELFTATS